jgi:hypothetical protein
MSGVVAKRTAGVNDLNRRVHKGDGKLKLNTYDQSGIKRPPASLR